MLLDAGARLDPEGLPPLLAVLNQPRRDTLAVLLRDRPGVIVSEFFGKSYLKHAIDAKSGLLPVIAALTQQELKRTDRAKELTRGLKSYDKKLLKLALSGEDAFLTADHVREDVERIRCPWCGIEPPIPGEDTLSA
jgi:hypothetical protein